MSDFVNHLRFVHNTLIILSLTILYIVWASWTSGRELRSDLEDFLRTAEAVRNVAETPERLSGLLPSMLNHHRVLSEEITRAIGYPVFAINPLRIRSVTSFPDDVMTIGSQWRALQDQEWILQKLNNPEDPLSELKAWLDDRLYYRQFLNRELRRARMSPGTGSLDTRDIRQLTTPILLPSVIDWPEEGSDGYAIVEFKVYAPMSRRGFRGLCEDLTAIAKYRDQHRDRKLRIVIDCQIFGPYRIHAQTETVRLPRSLFERYTYLQREFETIADLLPNDALERAAALQMVGLRGNDPRLFGARIRGEHIGLVGPFLITISHCYLLVMLYNLLLSVRRGKSEDQFLPWIVLMKGPTAECYSILTIVVLPAIAATLPVWRLTTVDGYLVIVIAISLLGFGIGTIAIGRKIIQ